MSNNDKKWSSNAKAGLLFENFRKFVEEGDFSTVTEYGGHPHRHKLADDHKAKQIVAWYLSQGNRHRTPHSASDLVDGLGAPAAEEAFERYGTTHDEMVQHIEAFVKEIIRDVRSGANPRYPDRSSGTPSRTHALVFDVPDAEEGGEEVVYKGAHKIF